MRNSYYSAVAYLVLAIGPGVCVTRWYYAKVIQAKTTKSSDSSMTIAKGKAE